MRDSSQQTNVPREATAAYYAQRAIINMARARAAGREDETASEAVAAYDFLQKEAEEAGREIGYAARLFLPSLENPCAVAVYAFRAEYRDFSGTPRNSPKDSRQRPTHAARALPSQAF